MRGIMVYATGAALRNTCASLRRHKHINHARRNIINGNAMSLGVCIALGIAVGAAFAVSQGNSVWIGVGAAMGIALGLIIGARSRRP